jgi:hypothetical protein
MKQCIVDGCETEVSKPDHELCYRHYSLIREGKLSKCSKCGRPKEHDKPLCSECFKAKDSQPSPHALTATAIGSDVGLKAEKVNAIFSELGWIMRHNVKGWVSLPQGRKQGAIDKEHFPTGVPFVVWPESILSNELFLESVHEFTGAPEPIAQTVSKQSADLGFRQKYPAEFRTADGHVVRSKAEVLIDNWLYMNEKAHAYEKKVPISEDLYCDFYLPEGKVYLEYWGLENDAAYAKRKAVKQGLYRKNELKLIELCDEDIQKLDDVLPAKLLKFNIKVA